jgi:hypothetical protein
MILKCWNWLKWKFANFLSNMVLMVIIQLIRLCIRHWKEKLEELLLYGTYGRCGFTDSNPSEN